jgi:hypothetical protein
MKRVKRSNAGVERSKRLHALSLERQGNELYENYEKQTDFGKKANENVVTAR